MFSNFLSTPEISQEISKEMTSEFGDGPVTFKQLLFVYNSIMNGWTVKHIGNGQYELEKNLSEIPSKYKTNGPNGIQDVKDTFIYKFLKCNLKDSCSSLERHRFATQR